jgi:hypothetical protein
LLILARQKLVLLSVPKTSSTANEEALTAHAAISVTPLPELKHSLVFRYNRFFRPMVERFAGPDADIVAVMREPIAWLGVEIAPGRWNRSPARDLVLSGRTETLLRRKYALDFALYASIRLNGAYTFAVESPPPDG